MIGAHLSEDPALAKLVEARPGLRVPGAWDGFELAVRGILGQQISVGAARGLAAKLVAAFGTRLPPRTNPPSQTSLMPSHHRTRSCAPMISRPRSACPPARRGNQGAGGGGTGRPSPVRARPGSRREHSTTALTRRHRRVDSSVHRHARPAGTRRLSNRRYRSATRHGHKIRRPTTAQLQARAAGWRPWRSYAALHLWASDPTDKRGAKEAPNETVVRSYVIADRNSAVRV